MNDPLGLFDADEGSSDPLGLFEEDTARDKLGAKTIGALETGAAMVAGVPAQIAGGIYGLGTLLSGQGIDKAGEAVKKVQKWNFGAGEYVPSTDEGKRMSEKVGNLMALPGEKAGDLAEKVGLDRIHFQLPVDAAMNFIDPLMVVGAAKGAAHMTTRKPKVEPAKPDVRSIIEEHGKVDPNNPLGLDLDLSEGPNLPPVMRVTRDGQAYEPTIGAEIAKAQQEKGAFEQQLPGAVDAMKSFDEAVGATRAGDADAAIARRDELLQDEMRRNTVLAMQAAERQRMQNAPTGAKEAAEAALLTDINQSTAKTQELNQRGQQMAIVEDFGNNDPMARMPEMRVDENGIPIRADLSMEAQNLQNPLQRNLWGDELPIQTGDNGIPMTQALDQMPNLPWKDSPRDQAISQLTGINTGRRGQGGGIDFEGISSTLKGVFSGNKTPRPDNKATPRSEPLIIQKDDMRKRARALGLEGTPYDRITTVEEALHNPGPDIYNNPVRNSVKPGSEGMLRSNSRNKILNFTRTTLQEARNSAEAFSKKYVTGKDGINAKLRVLNKDERMYVAEVLQEASRQRKPLDDALIAKLGLNEKQAAFVKTLRDALDEMYAKGSDALMTQGFEPLKYHKGYVPSMFNSDYTALIGIKDKDGKFRTKGIAQADTRYGLKSAIEWYQKQDPNYQVVKVPRRGLKDKTYNSRNVFNGFNDLVAQIAKLDDSFAELKQLAEQHAANSVHALYKFDLHEKNKSGVRGAQGDRPWLSREQNANDFFEGVIDYMESGARYYSYQSSLNDLHKIATDPTIQSTHPNTLKYLDEHVKHVTGRSLHVAGAAANWALDVLPRLAGFGPKIPAKFFEGLRTVMTAHMMGMMNVGFFQAQLTQLATGGVPEALAIRQSLGLDPSQVGASLATVTKDFPQLYLEEKLGQKAKFVSDEMRSAYEWARDQGMFDFSETELAHDVLKSDTRKNVEKGATVPIWLGEQMTRPPVFMWFADMFQKAGFKGEDAFLRAQSATDYAMANYHPDERAHIYQQLGVLGQFMGALTTYKHNMIDQLWVRGENAVTGQGKKRQIAPAVAALGLIYALQGITGIPGYEEANEITQALTGHSIRELVLDDPKQPHHVMDGLLSATTGYDFQARLSMSNLVPDNKLAAFSPHLSNTWNIVSAAIDYANNLDTRSFNELAMKATPSGMRGIPEWALRTDSEGYVLDKESTQKYDEPRTFNESAVRAVTGIRPLRERLEDEDFHSDTQTNKHEEDQLKELSTRAAAAIRNGDQKAYDAAYAKYVEIGGNPDTITSNQFFEDSMKEAVTSKRSRNAGRPTNNLNTIRRYNNYND